MAKKSISEMLEIIEDFGIEDDGDTKLDLYYGNIHGEDRYYDCLTEEGVVVVIYGALDNQRIVDEYTLKYSHLGNEDINEIYKFLKLKKLI